MYISKEVKTLSPYVCEKKAAASTYYVTPNLFTENKMLLLKYLPPEH